MLSRARTHQAAQLGLRDNEGVAGREAKRERGKESQREGIHHPWLVPNVSTFGQRRKEKEKKLRFASGKRKGRSERALTQFCSSQAGFSSF